MHCAATRADTAGMRHTDSRKARLLYVLVAGAANGSPASLCSIKAAKKSTRNRVVDSVSKMKSATHNVTSICGGHRTAVLSSRSLRLFWNDNCPQTILSEETMQQGATTAAALVT